MSCGLKDIKDMVKNSADDGSKDAETQIKLMEELIRQKMKNYYNDITYGPFQRYYFPSRLTNFP